MIFAESVFIRGFIKCNYLLDKISALLKKGLYLIGRLHFVWGALPGGALFCDVRDLTLFIGIFCDGLGSDYNLLTLPHIHPCSIRLTSCDRESTR